MIDIILPTILFIIGTFLLIRSARSRKKKKENLKKIDIEKIEKINIDEPKQELEELSKRIKEYIKKRYNISDRLSLNEIIRELDKLKENRLKRICEKIKGYCYTEKKSTKFKNEQIKKELIETIKTLEYKKRKEEWEKKKRESYLDKIINKEQEIKEEIRLKRIINSKIGKKNLNSKKDPTPQLGEE